MDKILKKESNNFGPKLYYHGGICKPIKMVVGTPRLPSPLMLVRSPKASRPVKVLLGRGGRWKEFITLPLLPEGGRVGNWVGLANALEERDDGGGGPAWRGRW